MLESSLITLREGFEAALIVAIVLAYLRRSGRLDALRAAWIGVGSAVVVSIGAGVVLRVLVGGLEGSARNVAFGVISLVAAGVLTWMIFWMRTQARHIKGELETKINDAAATGSLVAIGAVTFVAVVREGIETALFLVAATTASNPTGVIVGGLLGLAVAIMIAVAIYGFGRRMPMRTFFRVTGAILIVFAAGLMARTVGFFQWSGHLGSLNMSLYDVTRFDWLTTSTQTGRFLGALFGWDPRPSIEQVVVYLGYLIPVLGMFLLDGRYPWRRPLQAARGGAKEPVASGHRDAAEQRANAQA